MKKTINSLWQSLFVIIVCILVFFILLFVTLAAAFNLNGGGTEQVSRFTNNELNQLHNNISNDFIKLSYQVVAMSQSAACCIDDFCSRNDISPDRLQQNTQLIEPLINDLFCLTASQSDSFGCSGAFVILDATINPTLLNGENSRAGLFLKKTGVNTPEGLSSRLYCLRGPAKTARANKVELMSDWQMEFNLQKNQYFNTVMDTARANADLPPDRLYYWTDKLVLSPSSEPGLLVCMPIITADGCVVGVCGGEISNSLFKQLYAPGSYNCPAAFCALLPGDETLSNLGRGMLAGSALKEDYLSCNLTANKGKGGFNYYKDRGVLLSGLEMPLSLYPKNSPYENEQWKVMVLMPKAVLINAIEGDNRTLMVIAGLLLALAVLVAVYASHRYLRPVMYALNSIKTNEQVETPYTEINDLMDFLATKEKQLLEEQELALSKLATNTKEEQEHKAKVINFPVESKVSESAASSKRAYSSKEAEPYKWENLQPLPMFDAFMENIKTLSKAEMNVFNLYMEGYSAQQIAEELHLSINTIKTHNRRIYAKLNVSTRKELMVYIDLLKETDYFTKSK